jgi:hypothetical protein
VNGVSVGPSIRSSVDNRTAFAISLHPLIRFISNFQMKEFSFVGTVAFVESDQIFYGRVENGWRSFVVNMQ